MIPDNLRSRFVRAIIHMQVFVGFVENPERVPQPDNLALFDTEVLRVHAQPSREEMRILKEELHRASDQSSLAIKQGGHILQLFGTDIRMIGKLLSHML